MKRSNPVLALCSYALSLALGTGCIAETASDEPGTPAPVAEAQSADSLEPAPPTFEVTPLADGSYRFVGEAVVERSVGRVWAEIKNIENVVEVVLPGVASDFQWVDGGGPGKVPSRFSFVASGTTMLEEVFHRSHADHEIRYRLVTPGLGIVSYTATIALAEEDAQRTRVVYTREMSFADPALVPSFIDLLQLEMVNLQNHFAR